MPAAPHLVQLSTEPRLYQIDGFAEDTLVDDLLRLLGDTGKLAAAGIALSDDETGLAGELPIAGDATLEALRARIDACVGITNEYAPTLRFRRYRPGQGHPPHRDNYRIAGHHLVATAILYLNDTEAGGETWFPEAKPHPIRVSPRRGRLLLWFNHLADGAEDPAAAHQSLPVTRGEKWTLASFVYAPPGSAAATAVSGQRILPETRLPGTDLRFHCINDGVPAETIAVLRSACARRGVTYTEIDAPAFDYTAARPLAAGDLLYRPAVSMAAVGVEQFLSAPGVASFYATAQAVTRECIAPVLVFDRAGLPVPRNVPLATTDRGLLRRAVAWLGGFPLVLKWPGRERGVGVVRVDSWAALFSLADFAASGRVPPMLCQYVADARHYRLVVIGGRVAAAYRNAQAADDFRSYGSDDPAEYLLPIDPAMADIALRAARLMQVEMAGVDILRAPDGALYLLEANFPCYFAQAQYVTGVDLAGMMIDHLLRKAAAGRIQPDRTDAE